MSSQNQNSNQADQIREEVRRTIRQLTELTRTEESFDTFCGAVLGKLVDITGAHGALFWQVNGQGLPKLTHHSGQAPHDLAREILSPENESHSRAILDVVRQKLPIGIASEAFTGKLSNGSTAPAQDPPLETGDDEGQPTPVDAPANGDAGANPFVMLLSPVVNRQKDCIGTVELIQRGGITNQAQEGYLRFVTQIAALFQRWHEQQDLARLSGHSEKLTEKMQFLSQTHSSIDFKETAYNIANEARRLLNADRVSVGRWNGRTCKITSISSQDRFDNRANVVRKLSNVATAAVGADQTFWITGDTTGIAPEVAKKINDYLDEANSRTLAVIPLAVRPPDVPDLNMNKRQMHKVRKLGALIVEYFDDDVTEDRIGDECKLIVEHSQLALDNARAHGEIFLQPILKRLGWLQQTLFGDHLKKTLTGLAALALITLAMIFVPWELTMRVDGVLHPEERRTVFAEAPGYVKEFNLKEKNIKVRAGDLILLLDDHNRAQEMSAMTSNLTRLEEQAASLARSASRVPRDQQNALKSQRDTILAELAAAQRNIKMAKETATKLFEKRAPIAGTIVSWDLEQRLRGFPVQPNQALFSVANLDGPWRLEIKIPHQKIGYVGRAMEAAKADGKDSIDAEFTLNTNANKTYSGKLKQLAMRPYTDGQSGTQFYRAVIEVNRDDLEGDELTPGAGTTVRVSCGKVPLYKRCFYQVTDWFKTTFF